MDQDERLKLLYRLYDKPGYHQPAGQLIPFRFDLKRADYLNTLQSMDLDERELWYILRDFHKMEMRDGIAKKETFAGQILKKRFGVIGG